MSNTEPVTASTGNKPVKMGWAQRLRTALRLIFTGSTTAASKPAGQNAQAGPVGQDGQNAQAGQGSRAAPGGQRRWLIFIPVLCGIGVVVALIYVTQVPGASRWSAFGTAVAVAGASALVGGVIGFLFGIPLTNQNSNQNGSQDSGGSANGSFKPNTNLEQVSDWLTKIIVGVGLVQIGHALPALSRLAKNLKDPLGGLSSSSAFGLGLAIYFAVLGFLYLYLWSREILPGEFSQGLIGVIQKQLDNRDTDRSNALGLVNSQLDSAKSGSAPAAADLTQAVTAAPESTRILIYNEAEQFRKRKTARILDDLGTRTRSETASDETLKVHQQAMEPVIPVFQALVAADASDHGYHGSLGWALKDKTGPADTAGWNQAIDELTTAITLRGSLPGTGWRLYEANRAVGRIQQYNAATEQAARDDLAKQIWADLDQADLDAYAKPMVDPASKTVDPDIKQWRATGPPHP